MTVTVTHQDVHPEAAAVELLAAKGLHTLTLDVEPVRNSSHWHHFDAEFHILEGTLEITDKVTGAVHACSPGSIVSVPARSLHAEHSEGGYRIVLGSSVPAEQFGEPVNREPSEL